MYLHFLRLASLWFVPVHTILSSLHNAQQQQTNKKIETFKLREIDILWRRSTAVPSCTHTNVDVVSQINTGVGGCELCCPSVEFVVAGAPINIPSRCQNTAVSKWTWHHQHPAVCPHRPALWCCLHDAYANSGGSERISMFCRRSTVNRSTTYHAS